MDAPLAGEAHDALASRGGGGVVTLLDALATHLRQRGYAPRSCTVYRQGAQHFLGWRGRDGASVLPFAEDEVAAFVTRHLKRCRCPRPRGDSVAHIRSALRHLVRVARAEGQIIAAPPPGPAAPADAWLAAFDAHLRTARGLAVITRAQQTRYVREFLATTFGTGPVDFLALSVPVLVGFVTARAATGRRQAAKHAASALRGFLRFLVLRGLCASTLVASVPTVADWHARFLPKGMPTADVDHILQVTDTATTLGRRDHALVLCMARLGLRAGETAQLTLDDLDWRAGTLRLAAPKEGRTAVLPLPMDVGRAIGAYLRSGRPATSDRHVFLTHKTPAGGAMSGSAVCSVVRRARRRAGLVGVGHGTHSLRHALAGRMVQAGSTLKEIADVLRHRHLDTTAIYTKVDLPALATVALPWPEVAS